MKKIFALVVVWLLFLASPVFAENSTSTANQADTIKQLKEQTAQLTAELVATKKEVSALKEELRITKTLKFGMADNEVRKLQEFLSTMPDIYPEGLVTGYFGPLTQKAVRKLQEKNGLESIGIVGPKTRAKLSELSSGSVSASSSTPTIVSVSPSVPAVELKATTTPPVFENRAESHATTTPSGTFPATPAVPSSNVGSGSSATPAIPAVPATKDETPTTWTIVATAETGGTVSPAGSVAVTQGTSKTFTITPNAGYTISVVSVDGVSQGAIGAYTFTNVTAGHTITATFTISPVVATACGGVTSITDSRDTNNPVYQTVEIGSQCWLKRNLNVGAQIAGNIEQANNGSVEKYCSYDSDTNCLTYGGLYKWNEAMNYSETVGTQGICLTGWHVPSVSEWNVLGSLSESSGGALKDNVLWNGSNTTLFSGLPGGLRYPDGSPYPAGTFGYRGDYALFWTSNRSSDSGAYDRFLSSGDNSFKSLALPGRDIGYGLSVRCIKD